VIFAPKFEEVFTLEVAAEEEEEEYLPSPDRLASNAGASTCNVTSTDLPDSNVAARIARIAFGPRVTASAREL
jgi:hypothetical protein